MFCSAMNARSRGAKTGDDSSKRPGVNTCEGAEDSFVENKWCKAIWYRKGKKGKTESEVIPRSWVSKSRNIVTWPPKTEL